MNLNKIKTVYFFGIGGIGVSAVARFMIGEGKKVSGSDTALGEVTEGLQKLGVKIFLGQKIENISEETDLIIYSAALEVAEPEFVKKLKSGKIPAISYSESLGLISQGKKVIAVAGTHGKTTTTAMIAKILKDADLDPTVIVGSLLTESGSNFIGGKSEYFVVEADEYRRSFLSLYPYVLVITNIDEDHLDYYKNLEDIEGAFLQLAGRVHGDGVVICNISDPNLSPILENIKAPVLDYGSVDFSGVSLKFPGNHNRENGKAALLAGAFLGVPENSAKKSLAEFSGTWRRFEKKGETASGAIVYDDYAHNPAKVRAVLEGAREIYLDRKIIAVFQPHLFSRTKSFLEEFAKSFSGADEVILLPIYPAREKDPGDINSEMLAEKIRQNNIKAKAVSGFGEAEKEISKLAEKDDVVIMIGAGDINKLTEKIIKNPND